MLETHEVLVTEVLSRIVSVIAENKEDAVEQVEKLYKATKIVLDADDFEDKSIVYIGKTNYTKK